MIGTGLQLPGIAPQSLMIAPQSLMIAPQAPVFLGGLTRMESAASVMRKQMEESRARASAQAQTPVVTGLAGYVQSCWTKAKEAKLPIERSMLRAVRASRGEYDPEKLAQIRAQGGSEIYMMLFSTKARQCSALIKDVMIGSGAEKPWTVRPTAKPEVSPDLIEQVMAEALAVVQQAEMSGVPMSSEDLRQMLKDYRDKVEADTMEIARERAKRMETLMEDQTVEGGWMEALDQIIDDLAIFKTVFMKGPVIRNRTKPSWVARPDGSGEFDLVLRDELAKEWERVDPFMIYPAPWSRGVNDAWLIERHQMMRGDLSALIGVEGYSEDAIRAVLADFGASGLREWLTVDTERQQAEGKQPTVGMAGSDLIDALQFWGPVSGKQLVEWGMDAEKVPDPAKEYEAEVWLIGPHVIKAAVNADPLKRRPYYATGFHRIPGAFWHNSLFDTVEDVCSMCNAAARALANNMGISSGPQVVINVDRLPVGAKIEELYPWKMHQTLSDPMGSTAPAITFFQPASNAQELMMVYNQFSVMADEQSGIPRYMTGGDGAGGAGRTASGLSMMVGNASKTIKAVVGNVDINVISLSINRLYFYNMRYSDNVELKGDVNIVARGALSLANRESAMVRRTEFLARTANPIDMQIMGAEGRAYLLRETARSMELDTDKVVPSLSVLKAKQFMDTQAQQAQLDASGGAPEGSQEQLMNGAPTTDNFSPMPA